MATPKMTTKDGFEFQLGINHFGHFLWTMLLLPMLQEGGRPVRIINVASAAHQNGKLDFSDLNREKTYSPQEAYGEEYSWKGSACAKTHVSSLSLTLIPQKKTKSRPEQAFKHPFHVRASEEAQGPGAQHHCERIAPGSRPD